MTSPHDYPETAAGPFPEPPVEFTDRKDRPVTIRALEDDFEGVVEMYDDFNPSDRAQGIPPIGEGAIRDWLDRLFEDGCLNVVAVSDGDVVGHAALVEDSEVGYELAIFVHQDFQGSGIGTRLLRTLLGHGQAKGVEKVWLTVERWNRPAVELYEKVGFERAETEGCELQMTIRLDT